MTRLERFERQLEILEARRRKFLGAGQYVKAIALGKDLEKIREEIDGMRKAITPRPLSEVLPQETIDKSGIMDVITEIHLAVDYLTDLQYRFVDVCEECRIEIGSLRDPLKEVVRHNNEFVSYLMEKNEWLERVMTDNDTLNEALHKKMASYIKQRKPKKGRRKKE